MRIFLPRRSARSRTATRRPRFPASMAQKRPAAPAPRIMASNLRGNDKQGPPAREEFHTECAGKGKRVRRRQSVKRREIAALQGKSPPFANSGEGWGILKT